MLYQWGRKDGFPGADGSSIQPTTWENNATTIPIYGKEGNITHMASIGVNNAMNGTQNALIYSIKNPLTFIVGTAQIYDWYTNQAVNQKNILWGEGSSKSTYDPCPQGWRVPANGTWNDFATDNTPYYIQGQQTAIGSYTATNGRLYKNIAWYAAQGLLDSYYAIAALWYIGKDCYSWSSSISDNSAHYFLANMGGIYPTYDNIRANGMSVRCVQE